MANVAYLDNHTMFGRFHGEAVYTPKESDCLVRLPIYCGLAEKDRAAVVDAVLQFLG